MTFRWTSRTARVVSIDSDPVAVAHFVMVDPGPAYTPLWRPEHPTEPLYPHPERSATYAAVGREPDGPTGRQEATTE